MNSDNEKARAKGVLLVEDSATQAIMSEAVIEEVASIELLETVEDGLQAMAYLKKEGKFAGAIRPDVVLLDVHMPNKSGFEVLREIRQDEELRSIQVVMTSSTESAEELETAEQQGADACIRKPLDADELATLLEALNS